MLAYVNIFALRTPKSSVGRTVSRSMTTPAPAALSGALNDSKRIPVIYSDLFLDHHAGRPHPERPERLKAIIQKLKSDEALTLGTEILEPSRRRDEALEYIKKVHMEGYIEDVEKLSSFGDIRQMDGDTYVNGSTFEVAIAAVGAWMDAVDLTMETSRPSFALTRPPGHHAMTASGQGFCIFSNAAIAACYAIEKFGLSRVSILDWDVHYGNGTASWVKKQPMVRMTSSHQWPYFPFTGDETDQGPLKNVRNIALSAETNWASYESRFRSEMLPFIAGEDWPDPELVIVSAGYDALDVDPLAQVNLTVDDFAEMTAAIFDHVGHGRILFGLEGGYHLNGLSEAVAATIRKCIDFNERS